MSDRNTIIEGFKNIYNQLPDSLLENKNELVIWCSKDGLIAFKEAESIYQWKLIPCEQNQIIGLA